MEAKTVLLVEDEEFLRGMLEEFLRGKGYEVVAVESGEKALKIVSDRNFQLGLFDVRLPGMDGIELASRVRQVNPDTVVVIMTGYPSIESVVRATKTGAYDYLVKPFRLVELERVLERALEEWRIGRENRMLRERLAKLEERLGKYEFLESHRPFEKGKASTEPSEAERRYLKQSRWSWRRWLPVPLPSKEEG
ncbi:MAG TPA: response regulator [Candidatus Latescibacteria bacterium]|nr:response regulator [Candidatus Latescibacterota bacterium]